MLTSDIGICQTSGGFFIVQTGHEFTGSQTEADVLRCRSADGTPTYEREFIDHRIVDGEVSQDDAEAAVVFRLGDVRSEHFGALTGDTMEGEAQWVICLQVTEGSFPEPVCTVGWIEKEVDAWIRQQTAASRGDAQ